MLEVLKKSLLYLLTMFTIFSKNLLFQNICNLFSRYLNFEIFSFKNVFYCLKISPFSKYFLPSQNISISKYLHFKISPFRNILFSKYFLISQNISFSKKNRIHGNCFLFSQNISFFKIFSNFSKYLNFKIFSFQNIFFPKYFLFSQNISFSKKSSKTRKYYEKRPKCNGRNGVFCRGQG